MSTAGALPPAHGLYDPAREHDACGVAFVVNIDGRKRRKIIDDGLEILRNLSHRGAVGADPLAGDGAGLLLQMPHRFFAEVVEFDLPAAGAGDYAVGMVFMPPGAVAECRAVVEKFARAEGQRILGWRAVPVDNSGLGTSVLPTEPVIEQVFIGRGECGARADGDVDDSDAFERKLFVIRKQVENAVRESNLTGRADFYIASMSSRVINYKGMLLAGQLSDYYADLADARMESALALVHQRFSTNTFPAWKMAHPYRMIAHNGEINTLRGNINWFAARRRAMASRLLGDDLEKVWPLIIDGQSDSASFDNALELLTIGGYSLAHAMMLLIPEAWSGNPLMDAKRRAFYEYHAALMEPWDGPAAVAFTDGRQIGATLDRNGLRPARYLVTRDGTVVMASEMGVLDIPESDITTKWRLQPGKMLLIDLGEGRIISDAEIKNDLASKRDYRRRLDKSQIALGDLSAAVDAAPVIDIDALTQTQQAFGYTQEDLKFLLLPMVAGGAEGIGSMGTDVPPAVLSARSKPLASYFKQNFAQVTNPPIDPIREALVMELRALIGPRPNLLDLDGDTHLRHPRSPRSTERGGDESGGGDSDSDGGAGAGDHDGDGNTNPGMRLVAQQPILSVAEMAGIQRIGDATAGKLRSQTLDITFPTTDGAAGMQSALDALCAAAERAVESGVNILVLSDRGMNAARVAIPALLATAAAHHHLIRRGLRTHTGLVVETGACAEVHHAATLIGYGAEALCPYTAFDSIAALLPRVAFDGDGDAAIDFETAQQNYIKALGAGLKKVMSKMGISTLQSYCGAQIFDAVGLSAEFVAKYFTGTATVIEGVGLAHIAADACRWHAQAFGDGDGGESTAARRLDAGGDYAYRVDGEAHAWNPTTIANLQQAARGNDDASYDAFAAASDAQDKQLFNLRGLFEFNFADAPLPLDEVEPSAAIVKRFSTGAMSFGSISYEAHANLARAMNRLGGKSNTGEGGEEATRYNPLPDGSANPERSAIKQVASGRFGVTADYLVNADDLQIKMAQGAKPGEGGQLPGHKVNAQIARVRHSTPGVGLISPPPHHDIYSIEDLAQLIHDLKNVNPRARISVKLVSETGVGTVAAGVSKAHADHVTISGNEGGTGASPLTSIKHAGSPWEIGLAETHQTLVLNRLRGRIAVQVDGGLRTGRDVVIGALLGADEFGFATAPLVASGCIMMRKCHLNTCPVGVATQDPLLRAKFTGQPEHVVNYFFFVAEHARRLMARLGYRRMDEMVGQFQRLDMRRAIAHWKSRGLDYSRILTKPVVADDVALYNRELQDHGLDAALDHELIRQAAPALRDKTPVQIDLEIRNVNRSFGAMLSGRIAESYGNDGLPDDSVTIRARGTAGQSFGAWLARGVTIELHGEGNDYVGKGLSGGRLIIRPPAESGVAGAAAARNIIVGNTVLYGAIAGECFFSGVAGERFAVRNSGAVAVVEGVGDHGCEYMTGGVVVCLGDTGRNFAAGMSGGIAYVLDRDGDFAAKCNRQMVDLESVAADGDGEVDLDDPLSADESRLRRLIERHRDYTGSERAREVLQSWRDYLPRFVKIMPVDYRRALLQMRDGAGDSTAADTVSPSPTPSPSPASPSPAKPAAVAAG